MVIKIIFLPIQTTKDMQTTDADDALSLVMYRDLYNRDAITCSIKVFSLKNNIYPKM